MTAGVPRTILEGTGGGEGQPSLAEPREPGGPVTRPLRQLQQRGQALLLAVVQVLHDTLSFPGSRGHGN